MNIYVAVRDDPGKYAVSALIGAFSREDWAQDACQEDATETEAWPEGWPTPELRWEDAEALVPDGSKYVIVLTDLDRRTGT